jgi:hypothetical protein
LNDKHVGSTVSSAALSGLIRSASIVNLRTTGAAVQSVNEKDIV